MHIIDAQLRDARNILLLGLRVANAARLWR